MLTFSSPEREEAKEGNGPLLLELVVTDPEIVRIRTMRRTTSQSVNRWVGLLVDQSFRRFVGPPLTLRFVDTCVKTTERPTERWMDGPSFRQSSPVFFSQCVEESMTCLSVGPSIRRSVDPSIHPCDLLVGTNYDRWST